MMTGGHVTRELGRLEEKEVWGHLEVWGVQQCLKCGKGGLQGGGKVLRNRPVTEEMAQRRMGQKVH